jgi:hypothetical protein
MNQRSYSGDDSAEGGGAHETAHWGPDRSLFESSPGSYLDPPGDEKITVRVLSAGRTPILLGSQDDPSTNCAPSLEPRSPGATEVRRANRSAPTRTSIFPGKPEIRPRAPRGARTIPGGVIRFHGPGPSVREPRPGRPGRGSHTWRMELLPRGGELH